MFGQPQVDGYREGYATEDDLANINSAVSIMFPT